MPRYFMRITDNFAERKENPFGRNKPVENKYVLWSTIVDAPLCQATREEIFNETQFLTNANLRMASLDGTEAVASLYITRDTLIESATINNHEMTLGNVIEMYDKLPTLDEWKEKN